GVVAYNTDLNRAIRDERVAPAPLVIPAWQVSGKNKANVIVSNSDALLIHAAAKIQNFLRDCKVIIVTN
ncbi:hypothetical protein GWO43_09795, partial [candidate division KSB1 bacterium]|nr:hypothetical protein [candidate division KSB1 bacterium]NIR72287.1 hypothetical protein [candidate division KSB1 bacterium]NIS24258.1 hypothetical protein [candidate division KSB1 bacterium]NIT71173.1 hypothetical protein [candidate division KSB1 bacterium]NIU24877.1 hypothetical protein [candidate division KSB1 bacterium]